MVELRNRQILLPMMLATAACHGAAEREATRGEHVLEFRVVDNDSEYMRRVYGRAASDPAAPAMGVIAKEDSWANDGKQPGRDWYLEATDRGLVTGPRLIEGYVKALNLDMPANRELGFEETSPGHWRSYLLEHAVSLDEGDVASASVEEQPDGRSAVYVELNPAGTRALSDLTSKIAGKRLAAISGGVILMAPIVTGEIAGGKLTITLDADGAEKRVAETLVQKLAL